ncbi:MAG TPA: hypothetical protein VGV39_11635 [Mesorhizobium sp.]|uniref:hypothetical protein n=1 Tax=Mesorhizobium sp. TaxID=1871066 RepID=UPI002DDD48ED|nr:hypothetical protein [Mesorhizobium sp.]HEV2503721.1 hypothetical protein [Mesorhizobium sp.]
MIEGSWSGAGSWLLLTSQGMPHVAAHIWLIAVLAAATGLLSTLALYRSLKIGAVSIAAPIAATFGAVTTTLGIVESEMPGAIMLVGPS